MWRGVVCRYGVVMIDLAASAPAPHWVTYVTLGVAVASGLAVVWNRLHESGKTRRTYAESVAAWTGPDADCPRGRGWQYHWHDIVVRNGSDQPVYEVVVAVEVPDSRELTAGEKGPALVAIGLVPPGTTVVTSFGDHGQEPRQFAGPLPVFFNDARGVRWSRNAHGRLGRGPRRRHWRPGAGRR